MIASERLSNAPHPATRIVWAHGWGQSGAAFRPLAEAFAGSAENLLLDLPGFGASPVPPETWGTADYADAAAELLANLPPIKRTIWIGHSFGCRVGVQLAARHPGLLDAMVLIAAAGLKRKRSPLEQARFGARRLAFRGLKRFYALTGRDAAPLAARFGSADYRNAGPLRPVFVRAVNEDLGEVARTVTCPVLLVFGRNDTETPPDMGERYAALMGAARLVVLDHQDHYSVLGDGRHAVIKQIADFIKRQP